MTFNIHLIIFFILFEILIFFFDRYSLFNIGGTAALDVQISDNSFGPQDFDVVGGQLKVSIGRLFYLE